MAISISVLHINENMAPTNFNRPVDLQIQIIAQMAVLENINCKHFVTHIQSNFRKNNFQVIDDSVISSEIALIWMYLP